MKSKKITILVLLFIIGMLVLSLHIVELANYSELRIVNLTDGNSTTTNINIFESDNVVFFGESIKISILYNVCLYLIIFFIILCVILVAMENN